jgi:hypothetical protein
MVFMLSYGLIRFDLNCHSLGSPEERSQQCRGREEEERRPELDATHPHA